MIISASTVGMESVRNYSSLRMDAYGITNGLKPVMPDSNITVSESNSKQVPTDGKGSFQSSMDNLMKRFEAMGTSRITHNHSEESVMNRIRTECIIYLLRLLFGPETDDGCDSPYLGPDKSETASKNRDTGDRNVLNRAYNNFSGLFGYRQYEAHYYAESEEVSYNTTGRVITADGREIEFGLSFQMSRAFEDYYEKEHTFNPVRLCDPLVINLDSDIAGVSDQKFMFDIDADGVKDSISTLNRGSGFLAIDKNEDGDINDGSELFGTVSGDGFRDLAAYDSDGNGWIDEADPVWKKLVVYSMNEDGTTSMYGLSEKGVGAVYLGNVSTEYSLRNGTDHSLNAMIRKTGMFLYEDGRAGTVQHLDIAR